MVVSTAGILRRENRYLVVRRKPGTSIGEKWEFPGGKTEQGESPRDALVREWEEELSLKIRVGDLIFQGHFKNRQTDYKLQAFEVFLTSDEQEPVLTEHSEYSWSDIQELGTLNFPSSDNLIRNFIIRRDDKS